MTRLSRCLWQMDICILTKEQNMESFVLFRYGQTTTISAFWVPTLHSNHQRTRNKDIDAHQVMDAAAWTETWSVTTDSICLMVYVRQCLSDSVLKRLLSVVILQPFWRQCRGCTLRAGLLNECKPVASTPSFLDCQYCINTGTPMQ